MSILTEFLKLFKYTQEDKNNNGTFNIETALNENWDKVEANAKAVSLALEQKADKPIIIGSVTANIELIGEITNYATVKTFHLEAKLHNMYSKYGSMLSSAYIIVGQHNASYSVEGSMKILHDFVSNSIATTKIQITDTGKIYAINQASTNFCALHVEKTLNVTIYNNPTTVSAIDGNVIWDSEINKTKLATTDKIDISSRLLNGWVNDSSSFPLTLTICGKIATINGFIASGTVTRLTNLFTLPTEIVPSISAFFPAYEHGSPMIVRSIRIDSNSPYVQIDNNFDWVTGKSYVLNFSFPIK